MGPLELRPYPGCGWYQAGHPRRQRATYHRTQGTEQFLGFYDVHSDVLVGQVRKRKTHRDLLAVFERLRACYDESLRIYLVMDNLSSHRHPSVKMFYDANNIEPVWTPTYSSWLNAIEAHLSGIRKFAINGSDEPSHDNRRRRIQRYLTWRNQQHSAKGCPLSQFRHIKLERH